MRATNIVDVLYRLREDMEIVHSDAASKRCVVYVECILCCICYIIYVYGVWYMHSVCIYYYLHSM